MRKATSFKQFIEERGKGMRVMVLGGNGVMGSSVARDLVKSTDIEQVIIADLRADRSNMHPRLRDNSKITVIKTDINDTEKLIRQLKEVDAVVNCVGPFYFSAMKVIPTAIEAKVNYVDICDDYDATEAIFSSGLDARAQEAGITVLVGLGSDPGTGNLLAKLAASKLDQVDEIYFYWVLSIADSEGDAVWGHIAHMNTGMVPQFLEGKMVEVPAGDGSEVINFIEPFGDCEVHYVGHPEPITIPKYFQGVKTVVNKGGMLPDWANELIKYQAEFGFTSKEPIRVKGVQVVPLDVTMHLRKTFPVKRDIGNLTSAAKIVVKGVREGKRVTFTYDIAGAMAPGTGIPASIGIQMIGRGEIQAKGVLTPEGCVDPRLFFEEFKKRGAEIFEQEIIEGMV